jgi:AGZA family xanthine/uracil permease-like MFS transporter
MLLGGGAVLAGLMLGAITAFLIDRSFFWAAGYAAGGAVLGFIGLIHGSRVGWDIGGQIALGYLFAAVVFAAFGLAYRRQAAAAPIPGEPVPGELVPDDKAAVPVAPATAQDAVAGA